ncbi:GNAT family N-acetyltransferase [Bdellovibrio sp. ArHS]|uniref:GNAT family N-acetyltransferase n=1 Tax=Bdellovibrio sp. ArHS TaxID=1569284 RepID=UPI000AB53005|nr:GNAT family N-acetyltransferase [Bdellovibrio sp. ArHS]
MSHAEFEVFNHRTNNYYAFRRLSFEQDVDLYCRWMQQPYVAQWWGLNLSRADLAQKLLAELEDTHQELFIGLINGRPVSYFEKYWLHADALGHFIHHEPFDQGLHFLIGEPTYFGRLHTSSSIAAFTKLIFTEKRTQRVIGEPDIRNKAALLYAEANCFVQREIVTLPERTSAIMVCEREQFFSRFAKEETQLYRRFPAANEASFSANL